MKDQFESIAGVADPTVLIADDFDEDSLLSATVELEVKKSAPKLDPGGSGTTGANRTTAITHDNFGVNVRLVRSPRSG